MTAKVVEALVRNQCSLPAADDGGRSDPNDARCLVHRRRSTIHGQSSGVWLRDFARFLADEFSME